MKRVLLLTTSLFLFVLTLSSPLAASDLCNIADSAIDDAVRLRGLKLKKKVPCKVQQKSEVKQYLLDTIETKLPPGRLELEGFGYKALGLIAEKFAYKTGIVDLYVSQIGGYYDPEGDYFVMAGWMPAMLQVTIAVHELTHALQDQHFDLETFVDIDSENGDQQLARSALVEGDATAVMIDYSRELIGQGSIAEDKDVNSVIFQNVLGAGLVASSAGAPQSLIKLLIFPYTSGLRFAHEVLKRGGYKELDKIFKNPPETTEEILHPEQYFKKTKGFRRIPNSEVADFKEGEKIYENVFGEIGVSVLLNGLDPTNAASVKAAAGWAGDKLVVLGEGVKGEEAVWRTEWDSRVDAKEFFEAYSVALSKKFSARDEDSSAERFLMKSKMFERSLEIDEQVVTLRAVKR